MEARLTEPAKCASDAIGASVLAEGRAEIETYRIFSDDYEYMPLLMVTAAASPQSHQICTSLT